LVSQKFKANFSLQCLSRTLVKELIKEKARRDLDKNSFESKNYLYEFFIGGTLKQP